MAQPLMGVARGKRPAPARASPSLRPMRLRDGNDSPESWSEPLNYLYVQVSTTVSLLIRCVQRSTLTSHKSLKRRCCTEQMAYFEANHCQTSYCRFSLQMRHCAGGASLGGYGMPPAVPMKTGIGEPCESGTRYGHFSLGPQPGSSAPAPPAPASTRLFAGSQPDSGQDGIAEGSRVFLALH